MDELLNLPISNGGLSLSDKVDTVRMATNEILNDDIRANLGQFMTSKSICSLMSSMFNDMSGNINILDAGAGIGSLTASLVQRACKEESVENICSYTIECDETMLDGLASTILSCAEESKKNDKPFNYEVFDEDFIEFSVKQLFTNGNTKYSFNKAILNPPYVQIKSDSKERLLLRKAGIETGNLYSGFVALAIKMLDVGGELVAITPRSFCNGPYFSAFRELIFTDTSIKRIHIFKSRTKSFKEDKVLQENIIFHLVKGQKQEDIVISASTSATDTDYNERVVQAKEVIDLDSEYKFIHIVTDDDEADIAAKMISLPCTLADFEIEVSTGKVVDFRSREHLTFDESQYTVPLVYPQNMKHGFIKWPVDKQKKPHSIQINEDTKKLLIATGNYVLVKRFSSKEEKRRIVAAIYSKDTACCEFVGFDNKTNYFHNKGRSLDSHLAFGLSVYLNSTFVDKYFRQFNGHTQVNATDLRSLKYPSLASLIAMGQDYANIITCQEKIDLAVSRDLFLKE
jgi:adenine-specific DNA-methyltransferase